MVDFKPIFTKQFTAEFNTSQDTLRQLATMEWNIDEMFRQIYSVGININDSANIQTLYHYLVYIYADRLWSFSWTILQHSDNKEDKTFSVYEKELEELYYDWRKNNPGSVPVSLVKKMREYKRWLYEVKQKRLKLGVPTRTETTAEERMNKAAGV